MIQHLAMPAATSQSFSFDAATETFAGDVQAVIGNVLRAKYGDDWGAKDT